MNAARMDSAFAGVLGRDYEMLRLICPLAAEMSCLVGDALRQIPCRQAPLHVLELGGGTGITTLALLRARDDADVVSVDSAATMQNQAQEHLAAWVAAGRLRFYLQDALTALHQTADNSYDVVASAYTLHNFQDDYRREVLMEIYRVLKPGGAFVNGDRYALDDLPAHTRLIQEEVSGYFKVLTQLQRLDLLEEWIVHLFNDESEHHVMREGKAIKAMREAGFIAIRLSHRQLVNALMTARKSD